MSSTLHSLGPTAAGVALIVAGAALWVGLVVVLCLAVLHTTTARGGRA